MELSPHPNDIRVRLVEMSVPCQTHVVKTLIISDNQAFHDLIIKSFDNQTVSRP
jgi:hypothetical protein